MPCYRPPHVQVHRRHGGKVIMPVPCGSCLGCRKEQARQWAVRIMHECKVHSNAWFLTLTYNEESIPENGSLYPEDLRQFFKALRRSCGRLSYYACGEYGEQTERPHYHAVLFGLDLLDKCFLRSASGANVWRSPTLEAAWPHGLHEFSTVTFGSASYVAGYVRKKVSAHQDFDRYERVNPETGELVSVHPEFGRMSRRPAIGRRWIEKYWRDVYPADFVVVDGHECKPPRYYDKWLADNHPDVMEEVLLKRSRERHSQPVRSHDEERQNQESLEKVLKARTRHHPRITV